jgi:anti-sigma factor RsiW
MNFVSRIVPAQRPDLTPAGADATGTLQPSAALGQIGGLRVRNETGTAASAAMASIVKPSVTGQAACATSPISGRISLDTSAGPRVVPSIFDQLTNMSLWQLKQGTTALVR